ncbi:hypothetical protein F4861DRAFT_543648 [Xylaria intraflava]|nr:hypothetical protein F4861DRAFT_543648 [Xylaria intraflava]
MTRAPRHLVAPIPNREPRHSPYVVPDLSRFRIPRVDDADGDDVDLEAEDPLDAVSNWIGGTIVDDPEQYGREASVDLGLRGNTPIPEDIPVQEDALDVLHTILDRRANSEDLDDNDGLDDQALDGPVYDNEESWIDDDPQNIYAASDHSGFGERDGDEDAPPGHQFSKNLNDDNLEEYEPENLTMTSTEFKFALFLSEFNLSRRAWRALCEVITSSPASELHALPKWKPTLMDKFNRQLPKCAMRRKTVTLNPAKLPSRASPTEDLVWLDMEGYISKLLRSPAHRQHIYTGMAHMTRFATEFWHTRAWGESLRTTSGQFIRNRSGDYVLPSDFVHFTCLREECFCHRNDTVDIDSYIQPHLGRVTYCGLDKTGQFSDEHPITLIAPAYEPSELPIEVDEIFQKLSDSRPFVAREYGVAEVVLVQGQEILIPAENIINRVRNVFIDYNFDPKTADEHEIHGQEGDHQGQPYVSPTSEGFVVRYIWNRRGLQSSNKHTFIPARLTSPHRAELEMQLKPRSTWIYDFTTAQTVISLPWKLFIDAFGLYRNMYRSMTGVYPLPAFYPDHIANRRSSVVPMTVGLYGMETADLLKELSHINYLALGYTIDLGNDEKVYVCSFMMCFIGDFPQQQDLAGCKDHKALFPCRYCLIPKAQRHDLDFNVIEFGRYHTEITFIREKVKSLGVVRRNKKLKDLGLKESPDVAIAAFTLAPGLDLLRGRPIDSAHSEFTSLVKTAQRILFNEIITKQRHADFLKTFRHFPIPPRFHRVQSPATHLDSWRMQECTEVSIFMPILLHCWLTEQHVKPNFKSALDTAIRDDVWLFVFADLERSGHVIERRFLSNPDATHPPEVSPESFPRHRLIERRNRLSSCDVITLLFWNVARSNLLIFGRYPPQLTDASFMNIIYRGRKSLQLLFHIAAHASAAAKHRGPRGRTTKARDDQDNDAMSIASASTNMSQMTLGSNAEGESFANIGALSGRAKVLAYSQLKSLPNIHQGIHLWEIAREFGACRMVNTLLGEDQHKRSKSEVLTTNHRLVSETLIQRMNSKVSIDFGFAGAYKMSYPHVHEYFQDINKDCPSLSKRIEIANDEDNDEDNMGKIKALGDNSHIQPLVALTMRPKAVTTQRDELLNVLYPNRLNVRNTFIRLFSAAYENDYKHLDVVNFGPKKLRWIRRLSFHTGTSRRICIRVSDYIRTTYDMRLARVDGIFTHHFNEGVERAFLVLTFLTRDDDGLDDILDCPKYNIGDERLIIGLPAVLPTEVSSHMILKHPSDMMIWYVHLASVHQTLIKQIGNPISVPITRGKLSDEHVIYSTEKNIDTEDTPSNEGVEECFNESATQNKNDGTSQEKSMNDAGRAPCHPRALYPRDVPTWTTILRSNWDGLVAESYTLHITWYIHPRHIQRFQDEFWPYLAISAHLSDRTTHHDRHMTGSIGSDKELYTVNRYDQDIPTSLANNSIGAQ